MEPNLRPTMGCFPLYPPLELIHSMGYDPVVLWGPGPSGGAFEASDRHLQRFTCSVARRLAEFVLGDGGHSIDALFAYNACDTLRNLPEILLSGLREQDRTIPLFHFHVPMVPVEQTDSTGYFSDRITRLVRQLENASGIPFSGKRFLSSIDLFHRRRELCRRMERQVARGEIRFSRFAALLQEDWNRPIENQLQRLSAELTDSTSEPDPDRCGVILSGILPPSAAVTDAIEDAGLAIVGNDIASMHRSYDVQPAATADPVRYTIEFYRNRFPCPTLLYTADRRIESLVRLAMNRHANGLIFIGEKFCEYEYFEFPWLEKRLKENGITPLLLECSVDDDEHIEALKTRVEAYAELLTTGA